MDTQTVSSPAESHVAMLHRVSGIVSSHLSLDEMLGEVIGLAVQTADCDACLVYLIDRGAGEVVLRASQVPHAPDLGNLRMSFGEGVTGWVAENKAVVALASNASRDPRFKSFPGLVEDTYEAILSVPLVSGGEVIGVVNVHHREAHEHTPEEIATVVFIGEQLGGAIARSMLEDDKTRLENELATRKLVERAKGILQQKHSLSEEQAYLRLRNQSRRMRRSMKELAEAVILSEDMSRSEYLDE